MCWPDILPRRPETPATAISAAFFAAVLLLSLLPAPALADATIHGRTYDWSTFNAIDVAVIQVNTTPAQKVVTANGSYAFSLPGGDYTITAEARGEYGTLSTRENITVPDSGDFVVDLLLFPDSDLPFLKRLNQSLPVAAEEEQATDWTLPLLAASAAILLLAAGGAYLLVKKRKPPEMPAARDEAHAGPVSVDAAGRVLRPDCKEVLTAIARNGGRMTQLELRKALPYSEAKISLIASELEDAGLLRKVKKGRGNILILTPAGPGGEKPDDKEEQG